MEEQIRQILQAIGEDPNREGLLRTPQRVAQALTFLTRGYDMDPAKVINDALFTEDYEEMIVQKDIDFYSLCEHHLLPFFGKAHVAYIPHHKIVGISKLARLVDIYARRLQVQERMTNQIATIDHGKARRPGRRRSHRGGAFVHAHARRRKAELLRDHQQPARRLSHAPGHPQRIHDADPPKDMIEGQMEIKVS